MSASFLPFLFLAAAQPADASRAAQARAIVERCVIPPDRLRYLRAQELTDSGIPDSPPTVSVEGSRPLTDRQLRCLSDASGPATPEATGPALNLTFADGQVGAAYDRVIRRISVTNARHFLRFIGRWERRPRRHRGEGLDHFARRIELFCHAAPGGVLSVSDEHIGLVHDAEDAAEPTAAQAETWLCAFNASVVAGHDPLRMRAIDVETAVPIESSER